MKIFEDLLIAIVLPLSVPFFSYLLSDVIVENDDNNPNKIQYINDFWKEMSSSFIANSIWNITYHFHISKIHNISSWNAIFTTLITLQIGQLIQIKLNPNSKYYLRFVYMMCFLILPITIYRIHLNNNS